MQEVSLRCHLRDVNYAALRVLLNAEGYFTIPKVIFTFFF